MEPLTALLRKGEPQARTRAALALARLGPMATQAAPDLAARIGVPGPEGSTMKLVWSELDQQVKETAIEILGDSEGHARMGAAARARAEELFPLPEIVDRYEAYYAHILDR